MAWQLHPTPPRRRQRTTGEYFAIDNDWQVPSFTEALERVEAAGLGFDRGSATGVVITCDHTRQSGAVEYCVVAADLATADRLEVAIKGLYASAEGD